MPQKKVEKKSQMMPLGLLGASLVGLAAATYFFFGPGGKKNQKNTKAWAIKMKADVIEGLEKARVVSEPAYRAIIDAVAAKYEKKLKSSPKEVQALAQDLKKHWRTFVKPELVVTPASKAQATPKKNVSKLKK